MYGQEYGSAFYSFHGVQFHHGKVRMFFSKFQIIVIGASDAAAFVDFQRDGLFPAGPEPYFPGHIDVPGFKEPEVRINVGCLLATGDGIRVVYKDMMDRLSVFQQRADESVKAGEFLFGKVDARTGFTADFFVFFLRKYSTVKMLFECTDISASAAVADIRRLA